MKSATVTEEREMVSDQGTGAARSTVLVVEDYEETRFMVGLSLRMHGYRVIEATNGVEAVEMARREHPALILMDLNLPLLDGIEATRRIREDARMQDVPIVAMTAYGTSDYRLKALAAGCSEYMIKPLNFDQLHSVVDRLLHKN